MYIHPIMHKIYSIFFTLIPQMRRYGVEMILIAERFTPIYVLI